MEQMDYLEHPEQMGLMEQMDFLAHLEQTGPMEHPEQMEQMVMELLQ